MCSPHSNKPSHWHPLNKKKTTTTTKTKPKLPTATERRDVSHPWPGTWWGWAGGGLFPGKRCGVSFKCHRLCKQEPLPPALNMELLAVVTLPLISGWLPFSLTFPPEWQCGHSRGRPDRRHHPAAWETGRGSAPSRWNLRSIPPLEWQRGCSPIDELPHGSRVPCHFVFGNNYPMPVCVRVYMCVCLCVSTLSAKQPARQTAWRTRADQRPIRQVIARVFLKF